jgi:hypothetical protein
VVSLLAVLVRYSPIHNAAILLLAIVPLGASLLLLRLPLLYTLFKGKADPRTDLLLVLCIPSLGLLLTTSILPSDTAQLITSVRLLGWIVLAMLFYLAVPYVIVWKLPARAAAFFFLLILSGMYATCVIRNPDILADRAPAEIQHATVVRRYVSYGKSTTYYLRLTPWGPFDYLNEAEVPFSFYDNTRLGAVLCASLHPGLLRGPWYRLDTCQVSPTQAVPAA